MFPPNEAPLVYRSEYAGDLPKLVERAEAKAATYEGGESSMRGS